MNTKVTYAKFHTGIFFPGVGNCGDTLPASNKTLNGLNMYRQTEGLEVHANGFHFVVPWANVIVAVYEEAKSTPAVMSIASGKK